MATARRAVASALTDAGVAPEFVLAAGMGVVGPVGADGHTSAADDWLPGLARTDLRAGLARGRAWDVLVENDANLAVLGERWRGAATGVDDVVALLAGERLGAGVHLGGRLLRGRAGGTGQLGFMSLVAEVGNTDGIGMLARRGGAEAVERAAGPAAGRARSPGRRTSERTPPPGSLMARSNGDPARVDAEMVFDAARSGDPVAVDVVGAVSRRIARVVAILATLLDPELVVVSGAVSAAGDLVLPTMEQELATLCEQPPPRLAASTLGDHAVVLGAVRLALDHVFAGLPDLALPSQSAVGPPTTASQQRSSPVSGVARTSPA